MGSTRPKVSLFLGRHATSSSGLWVYGKGILQGLLEASEAEARLAAGLHCSFAGADELQVELTELIAPHAARVSMSRLDCGGVGRRLSAAADLLRRTEHGLVHGTANMLPLFGRAKRVLTLHDLLQAHPPRPPQRMYERLRRAWYRSALFVMLRKADVVVTDHEATRAEIKRRYPFTRKIEVVYPGLEPGYRGTPLPGGAGWEDGQLPLPPPLRPQGYLIAFTSADPRKNFPRAVQAFGRSEEVRRLGLRLLVLAADGCAEERARRAAADCPDAADRVVVRRSVPAPEMPTLYRGARGLLFPSLAEGFGYPVYEALSQGVPVLCRSSMLIGDLRAARRAAVDCRVDDTDSIAQGLDTLCLLDLSVAERESAAREVRELLDYRRAARRLLDIYWDLLQEDGA